MRKILGILVIMAGLAVSASANPDVWEIADGATESWCQMAGLDRVAYFVEPGGWRGEYLVTFYCDAEDGRRHRFDMTIKCLGCVL